MSLPKPTTPLRALLTIGTAVALAHLTLLQSLPTLLQAQAPMVVPALTTRSITPALPVPTAPAAAPTAKPRPARKARPAPAPQPDMAAPASTAVASLEAPEPAPAEPASTPPAPELPASAAVAPAPEPAASAPATPLTHATVFAFPDPVRLLYELTGEAKKLRYSARGELLWKQDGHSYEARLEASMLFLGSRTRTSTGSITPEGLAPQRFSDKWRSEVAAHFDQPNHRASFSANTPDVDLQPAAQDQLSVILQIASILAGDPSRYPPSATLAVQTIGPRDADTWVFTVEGPEKILLPSGEMASLKLTRNPRKPFDQKVEVWLAPSLGYLPVRLKITNANGDFVDQQLRGVEKP